MKHSFWATVAFKNLCENKKFYITNVIVNAFTIIAFYLFIFITNNDNLALANGYQMLKQILVLGCFFLVIITLMFRFFSNKFFIKRRNKEIGLYAVWGLEKKHINSILRYETIYIYIISMIIGITIGVLLQQNIYVGLFRLMKCDLKYITGFDFTNVWITMIVFAIIDFIIFTYNKIKLSRQKIIILLKDDSENQVRKLTPKEILDGLIGFAMVIGSYIYINNNHDILNSITTIFIVLAVLFVGSYQVMSSCAVMLVLFLKKIDSVYYKKAFFTTIAKLISRIKHNAMGLAAINILLTCVILGVSLTAALYYGTERQASNAYVNDGEISTTNKDDIGLCIDTLKAAAERSNTSLKMVRYYDLYCFPTTFDEKSGSFSNENTSSREMMDFIYLTSLDDFNKNENQNLTLAEDEVLFLCDEEVEAGDLQTIDIYGISFRIKETLTGQIYTHTDNVKYFYCFNVIVKDYSVIEKLHEHMVALGYDREIFHYIDYDVNGDKEEQNRLDAVLNRELMKIGSVDYADSKATQREKRYARNAIFLFMGAFISIIFVMYMIFIVYHKQIQEAIDDADNVDMIQKIGMSEKEVKRSILVENGILFFLPILLALFHVCACFGITCDVLKLFTLTDVNFIRTCIITISIALIAIYTVMYMGAYKIYLSIVMKNKK